MRIFGHPILKSRLKPWISLLHQVWTVFHMINSYWRIIKSCHWTVPHQLCDASSGKIHRNKNAVKNMQCSKISNTVEPLYNEVLGTMKITLLYQVSHYIRVKKQRNIKSWDQQNYLVIRGFCSIWPRYNEVPLYIMYTSFMIQFKLQSENKTKANAPSE